jgi:hypothetical protein
VRLDAQGALQWVGRRDNAEQIYTTEPNASLLKRVFARVLSWLPIDSLL